MPFRKRMSGQLLQECEEEWINQDRILREQQYLTALDKLSKTALNNGEFRRTAEFARRLIATDPLQESAYRVLIEALFRSGNAAEATQIYRDLRIMLRSELNTDPDPVTIAVFEELKLNSRAVAVRHETFTPGLPDAGKHSESPLRSLPTLSIKLLGRNELCGEALAVLDSSRVLTLTGTGGIGKTSIALEILTSASKKYAGGTVFVELARLTDPATVPAAVSGAMGIRDQRDEPAQLSIERTIGTSQYLLVLDNCEHLLEVIANLVASLVQHCPNLTVLCTSRQALHIRGERTLVVTPLSVPTDQALSASRYTGKLQLHDALEYPAVQLFVERSRQINPQFQPTPTNILNIIRICRQLDGNPLAIELAAARIRVMTPAQIEARLSDRFRLLVSGNRTDDKRQQTLRALVDWSYALLEHDERQVFACLSLFTGSCTIEAVEAICAGINVADWAKQEGTLHFDAWQVLDILHSLVDRSLVVAEEYNGTKRFTMHATIRAFAKECFAAFEAREVALRRYCQFFKDLALGSLQLPMDQSIEVVNADYTNILNAIEFSALLPDGGRAGLEVACALERFWHVRSHFRHADHYFKLAIAHRGAPLVPELYLLNRIGLANIARLLNRLQQATEMYDAIILDLADGQFPGLFVRAVGNFVAVLEVQGEFEQAKQRCQQALAVCRQSQLAQSEPVVLIKLASVLRRVGELDAAKAHYNEGIVLARLHHQIRFEYEAYTGLAVIHRVRGEFEQALDILNLVREHYQSINSNLGVAATQCEFAQIAIDKRETDIARGYLGEAIISFVDLDFSSGILGSLQIAVVLLQQMDRDRDAARLSGWCNAYRKNNGLGGVEFVSEDFLKQLEQTIGTEVFNKQRAVGARMSLDQAAALVLSE